MHIHIGGSTCYLATGSRSATRRGQTRRPGSGRADYLWLGAPPPALVYSSPLGSRAEPRPSMSRSAAVEPFKAPPNLPIPPPLTLQATPSAADAYRRTKHSPAQRGRRASAARTSARRCALLRRQAARKPRANPAMLSYSSSRLLPTAPAERHTSHSVHDRFLRVPALSPNITLPHIDYICTTGRSKLTPMAWGTPQDHMRERGERGVSSGHRALGPRNLWIHGSGLVDPRINGPPLVTTT